MKGICGPIVLSLVLASAAQAGAPPASASKNLGCGAGNLVLNVSYRVLNDVDTGLKGNNWAFDTYTRTVHVWSKGAGRFCSASNYSGEFTTIQGASPGGRWQLPAGIRGTFKGTSVTTFRGAFTPNGEAVRGSLGVKDFGCTSDAQKGQCNGTWDWLRKYFTGIAGFRYAQYAFSYRATENGRGTWSDTLVHGKVRFSGDIRPLKGKKP